MPVSYTREKMKELIDSGHSILIQGKVIDRVEDLPSDADLAAGDQSRLRAVMTANQEQIAALTLENQRLQKEAAEAPAPVRPEPVPTPGSGSPAPGPGGASSTSPGPPPPAQPLAGTGPGPAPGSAGPPQPPAGAPHTPHPQTSEPMRLREPPPAHPSEEPDEGHGQRPRTRR